MTIVYDTRVSRQVFPVEPRPHQFDHTTQTLENLKVIEDEIESALERIIRLKEQAAELATQSLAHAKKIDRQAAAELGGQLYWLHSQTITSGVICDALGTAPPQITRHIPAVLLNVTCNVCKREHLATIRSRQALKDALREPHLECDDCESKRSSRWLEETQERMAQVRALRTMPYQAYLKTDHWQALRSKMLWKVGYKCQLCNASNISLHVHHRTYENRGQEPYTDLIVLCANCHQEFHDKMELAK